jgi:hypothetical protein
LGTGGGFGLDQLLGGGTTANPEIAAEQGLIPKPKSGFEPLTYRLQGDNSVRLNQQVLPAKSHVSGMRAEAEFRLT